MMREHPEYKRRLITLCLAGLLSLVFTTVRGEDGDLDRIRKQAGKTQSLQAEFVQHKQMKILLSPLISKGRFYYKAPASIRWEYQSPIQSIVTMHRGEVRRYFKKDGKMVPDSGVSLQVMQVVMENITSWLDGRFDDSSGFSATVLDHRIRLFPKKEMSGMIERIDLILSGRSGVISEIVIREGPENYTKIEFRAIKINEPVADSIFQVRQ